MSEQKNQTTDLESAIRQDHELVGQLFSQLTTAKGDERSKTWDTIVRLLAVHETAEEMILHPTVRAAGEEANAAVQERLVEEDQAKKLLSDLEAMGPDAPDFPAKFDDFRRAVLAHADAEEREILPRLRDAADQKRLEGLGTAFTAAKAMAPTHPHPHSPESAIGNIVVGPAVAIMDRTRDVIKAAMDKLGGR
jgi:hemerythrin superfamily protein